MSLPVDLTGSLGQGSNTGVENDRGRLPGSDQV